MTSICMFNLFPSSRDAVTTHGLWDQLRVDHGREFYLMLYIQEKLRCNYGPPDIHPYVQSPSTEVGTSIRPLQ